MHLGSIWHNGLKCYWNTSNKTTPPPVSFPSAATNTPIWVSGLHVVPSRQHTSLQRAAPLREGRFSSHNHIYRPVPGAKMPHFERSKQQQTPPTHTQSKVCNREQQQQTPLSLKAQRHRERISSGVAFCVVQFQFYILREPLKSNPTGIKWGRRGGEKKRQSFPFILPDSPGLKNKQKQKTHNTTTTNT